MPWSDIELGDMISPSMLDLFFDMTGLSVSILLKGKSRPIYSTNNWPEFCMNICDQFDDEICSGSFSERELQMCRAGLWCVSFPIDVDGETIGFFTVGHRRIKDKDPISREKLGHLFDLYGKSRFDKIYFLDLFEKVDSISEEIFTSKLTESLSMLESYIVVEHKRAMDLSARWETLMTTTLNVSHQIKLPIQSLVAITENLSQDLYMFPIFKKELIGILEELTKLSYVAENLNHLNILEEKIAYEFKEVNIVLLVINTIKLFRNEAKKKGIDLRNPTFKYIRREEIQGSKFHLSQVFFNIYHNAIKYSYLKSPITYRFISTRFTQHKEGFISIEISNYGVGILENEIKEGLIFKVGYRGELSKDGSRTGSGLGLSYAKKIIKDHNGKIEVISEKLAEGEKGDPYKTTVKIYLPIKQR
jgi:signal transduction histidine kinase